MKTAVPQPRSAVTRFFTPHRWQPVPALAGIIVLLTACTTAPQPVTPTLPVGPTTASTAAPISTPQTTPASTSVATPSSAATTTSGTGAISGTTSSTSSASNAPTSTSSIPATTVTVTIPATITGTARTNAVAAGIAVTGAIRTRDIAFTSPTLKDWSKDISKYFEGPAKSNALLGIDGSKKFGFHQVGSTSASATVKRLSGPNITFEVCVDTTKLDFFDQSGKLVTASTGSRRFVKIFKTQKFATPVSAWLVTDESVAAPRRSC